MGKLEFIYNKWIKIKNADSYNGKA
jgi:hypothetical protein